MKLSPPCARLRLRPIDEKSAVTQVPTLVPKIMNIAIGNESKSFAAREITMAVTVDEDCTIPVVSAPKRNKTIICHQSGDPPSPPIAVKIDLTALSISGSANMFS